LGYPGLPVGRRRRRGGTGCGGLLLLVVLLIFGGSQLLGGSAAGYNVNFPVQQFPSVNRPADDTLAQAPDEQVEFLSFVFDDIQQTWSDQFAEAGRRYTPTRLEIFRGSVQTGCGYASSDTGPFYCPADQGVYLDLRFFQELVERYQAPGDFAQAYVIAHEVGHHVQSLLGISQQVGQLSQADPEQANELSVRQELQADCLAGVWAASTYERRLLEEGDLEEGIAAASAVGDDRIQQQTTGRINPESWTHGSAEQRATWFRNGFDAGNSEACDTFGEDV